MEQARRVLTTQGEVLFYDLTAPNQKEMVRALIDEAKALKDVDFRGYDLSGLSFQGMQLVGCDFRGANCQNTCFDNSVLKGCQFDSLTRMKALFRGAVFEGTARGKVDVRKRRFRRVPRQKREYQ